MACSNLRRSSLLACEQPSLWLHVVFDDSGGRWLSGKHIANTHLREQVAWMRGIVFDLAPESVHIHLEQMAFTHILLAPYMFEQKILRNDATCILR